ncbi:MULTISPECIES: hypothetical protein [unclassified Rathayibacter]|uniref:hypothetical protein n=1 Tax=unclassified Rathayibacter TaxID=2609250 RepID=UPI000F4C2BF0|nr:MULTISPECIES: hypothetical protein [unclassified Rathayibacter]ROP50536.1 D-mannose binding lectin [Rathayibacter sp. PhB186]ROS53495.1 D-mannose binding lectin [Rathayibacter sp. PhB185]
MPQPPSRRLAAITLACLLAAGGAAAIAPGASALAAVSSEPTSTQAPTAFRPGSASDDAVARGPVRYTNALIGGESLARGESITSEGGEYRFVLQTDGNAVIYDYRGSTWSTGTQGRGDRLDMQTDGNVVIYAADGRAVWSTGTGGNPGALLVMQDDGDLVVFRADDSVAWSSSDGQAPPAVADTLSSGSDLRAGQELVSTDGRSRAAMQTDGNFVVYSGGSVRFNAATSGPGNRLVMQSDGNAVVYANYGAPLWQSGTAGNPGARMVMQNDGNLVIYAASGRPLWSSNPPPAPVVRDVLSGGGELRAGQELVSSDGGSRAAMQGDGNFVVYRSDQVSFSTGTSGAGNRLAMQTDGNAVVYSASGRALWQSGTGGNSGARLVMQNDGNLVIYSGDRALWSSYTPPVLTSDTLFAGSELTQDRSIRSTDGRSEAVLQGDGNFVVYSNGSARWSAGTSGAGNRLVMQGDGNAVVYSAGGRALWQSGTAGTFGPRMVIQNDGNLVIYSVDDRAAWQSNQPAPASRPNGPVRTCGSFNNDWSAANAWFQTYANAGNLDDDGDGIPCETLRGAPRP